MSQTIEHIRDNVIKIVDSKGGFIGTGFFIEIDQKKYCLTCHHCIYNLDEIYVEKNNLKYVAEWIEEYSEMKKDIAVLAVKDCPIQPLKNSKEALGGLQVFVWGFPDKDIYHYPEGKPVEGCYLSRIWFLLLWEEKTVKGVNIWNKKPEVRVYAFQIKNKFEVGFSGSPVCYSITNQVVGMLTGKDDDYGYIIPIHTILEKIENAHRITEPSPSLDMASYINKGNKNFVKEDYADAIKQYDIVRRTGIILGL